MNNKESSNDKQSTEKPKCQCQNPAKFFCQNHKEFICHREMIQHPCLLIPVDLVSEQIKESTTEKISLSYFLKENKNHLKTEVFSRLNQKSEEFAKIIKEIESILNKLSESYLNLMQKLVKKSINQYFKTLEADFEKEGIRIFNDEANENEPNKAINQVDWVSEQIKPFELSLNLSIDNDQIMNTIKRYLSLFQSQNEVITSSVLAFSDFDISQKEEISLNLQRKIGQAILYENKDLIFDYLGNLQSESFIRFVGMLPDLNKKIQANQGNNQDLGRQRPARFSLNGIEQFRRRISGRGLPQPRLSFLQNHAQKRQSNVLSEIIGEIDFDEFDGVSEIHRRNSRISKNPRLSKISEFDKTENCDFEIEEEGLERSERVLSEQIKKTFDENLAYFCHLLDQVLFDINCDGFFSVDSKKEVNEYFDELLLELEQLIKLIKNSFNKT